MNFWQSKYKEEGFYWTLNPAPGLKRALPYAPQKGVALDIGAGEGRNSIFLAKNGFHVVAIDKIPEGLKKLENFAEKQDLSIETLALDIEKFSFPPQKYSLVLSVAALDFMRFSNFRNIIKKIENSLISQGVVYLSVFSVDDPFFTKLNKKQFKTEEKNTFYLPKLKAYRHFFEKEELEEVFKNFKIEHIEKKKFKDVWHGDPHFHHTIELIAKKRSGTSS